MEDDGGASEVEDLDADGRIGPGFYRSLMTPDFLKGNQDHDRRRGSSKGRRRPPPRRVKIKGHGGTVADKESDVTRIRVHARVSPGVAAFYDRHPGSPETPESEGQPPLDVLVLRELVKRIREGTFQRHTNCWRFWGCSRRDRWIYMPEDDAEELRGVRGCISQELDDYARSRDRAWIEAVDRGSRRPKVIPVLAAAPA